jgi:hypothetical protein
MLQGRTIITAVLLAVSLVTRAIEVRPAVVLSITMGDLDAHHPEVLTIYSARGPIGCSAVAIGSRAVLTAGHCVPGVRAELRLLDGTGDEDAVATSIPVAAVRVHPRFDPIQRLNDLAVMITGVEIEAVPLFLGEVEAETVLRPGIEVVVVGFGVDRASGRGRPVRRFGRAKIEAVSAMELRLLAAPSQPCAGDSGGAVFVETADRKILVGIISSGDPDCRVYSRAMRIDAYWKAFVAPIVAARALL